MIRKRLIFYIILLAPFFQACSSLDAGRIAPGYSEAYKALKGYFAGYEDTISIDLIQSIPYASLKMKIGKGTFGLLILESKTNSTETWISADEVYLEIKEGRIVGTKGLINDLINFTADKSLNDFISSDQDFNQSYIYISLDKPRLNNLRVLQSLSNKGIERVSLITGNKMLYYLEEKLESKEIGWKVINKFWIDENGFCWKSEQNISPKLPTFYIEVTKKPAI